MDVRNWKIGSRLTAGLGIAIIFMVGIAIIGITRLGQLNHNTRDLAEDRFPKVVLSYEVMGGVNDIARAMRNAMQAGHCGAQCCAQHLRQACCSSHQQAQ